MRKQIILISLIVLTFACNEPIAEENKVTVLPVPVNHKEKEILPGNIQPPEKVNFIVHKSAVHPVPLKTAFNFAGKPVTNPKKIKVQTNISKTYRLEFNKENSVLVNQTIIPALPAYPERAKYPHSKDMNSGNFVYYGKLQGLWHDVIKCIIQDKTGNIWIGTNGGGVSCFDGTDFSNFSFRMGLCSNFISDMLQDKAENIWFTSNGKGFSRYDGEFFINFDSEKIITGNNITAIQEDRFGNLWIAIPGKGVLVYNGEFFILLDKEKGLESVNISSLYCDKNGDIWIGNIDSGYSKVKMSKNSKGFDLVIENSTISVPDQVVNISKITGDSENTIWIASKNAGIFRVNGAVVENYTTAEGLTDDSVNSVFCDKDGSVWIAYNGAGISYFNGQRFENYSVGQGLSNGIIYACLQDNSGNLWFGADNGLNKFNGMIFRNFTEYEGLVNSTVYSILKDKNDNLYFCSEGAGVEVLDASYLEDNNFVFKQINTNSGFPGNNIYCSVSDTSGNIWFGSSQGNLFKYDGTFSTDYKLDFRLNRKDINCIIKSNSGNIWLGTEAEGLVRFNGVEFIRFGLEQGLSEKRIYSLLQDKSGDIWIGTSGGGITRLDFRSGKDTGSYRVIQYPELDGLGSKIINCIYQDSENNIWFGTNGSGVLRYQAKNPDYQQGGMDSSFVFFNEEHGMLNNNVMSIIEDKEGNIWMGTRFGLCRLITKKLKELYRAGTSPKYSLEPGSSIYFENYTYNEGFTGIGCNRNALFIDRKGHLWIGANDKITLYLPEGDLKESFPPSIQINEVELFNERLPWYKFKNNADTTFHLGNGVKVSKLKFKKTTKWYGLPEFPEFKYNNNYLTFRYTAITQLRSSMIRYRYFLENFDKNWSNITTENQATYGNLPAGEYIFHVKAMNSQGLWSQPSKFYFKVNPPYWKTWWFVSSVILFVIGITLSFYLWRVGNLKKQKVYLEKVVLEKTSELLLQKEEIETSLNNLQAAQNQIIQSEKMASLGILAAGVAHEINNPLNFIHSGIFLLETNIKEDLPDYHLKMRNIFEGINTGISRTATIVSSLSQYSRQNDKEITKCNLHKIIQNCLVMLQSETKNRIEIIKQFYDENALVSGNEGRLHQAFLNILINSVHAIEHKGQIGIKTFEEHDKIVLNISDNGNGISQENLKKIFDPFFTTKEPGKGTGLGLSIAYNIIHEHGGVIEIDSEENSGTTVFISLPKIV
ncbi:MAG: two-component regulator propeller domain-containing protein [Bacteroidales bacterium]